MFNIQSELHKNYFELFSLPVSFEIDVLQLSKNYQEIQREIHPDRFALSSEQEKSLAVQYAAFVNQAFNILKNPLQRAGYLLKLHKIAVDFENNTAMGNDFLLQQMELREEKQGIPYKAEPLIALDKLNEKVTFQAERLLAQLTELFSVPNQENLLKAKQIVQELKFIVRLEEELQDLANELEL